MLPSALAIAERVGGVDGKRLLTALIAGVEVACRIGKAIETAVAFTRTGTLAFLGSAATACNLLGLDAQTTRNALGIAYAQAAGNLQPIRDGALVKVMQAGFGAKGGVMSALWARRGLTGSRLVLEGPYGYLNLYERGAYQRDKLLNGLGDSFEVTQLSIKPYPCALDTHAAIMAALDLRARYGLTPQAIDRVTVDMPLQTYIATGGPYDEIQEHPQTRVVESSSRVSYVVAVALTRGRVNLDDFTQEAVVDTEVGDLAKRVKARLDERLPVKAFVPVTTRIHLKNGEIMEQTVDTLLGTPEKPMSREQRLEKFWHCADRAALCFPREQLEELISLVEDLEHVPDVGQLISRLAG
jgi:2-methylcitrate dehydratase PrpD